MLWTTQDNETKILYLALLLVPLHLHSVNIGFLHMQDFCNIESYVSNSHIGFDPDYEVIKKTLPASN